MRTLSMVLMTSLGLLLALAPLHAQGQPDRTQAPKVFLGLAFDATPAGAARPGIIVREVAPDGPAAKAGLKAGDIIVKVGENAITGPDTLAEVLGQHKAGDKLAVQVVREGKEQAIELTLGQRPVQEPQPPAQPRGRGAFLGVTTQAMNPELKNRLGVGVDKGVVVAEVTANSPAAKAGIKEGDVITSVGDAAIGNPDDLFNAVQKTGAGKELVVKVTRGKDSMEMKAQLEEPPAGGVQPTRPRIRTPEPPAVLDMGTKVRDLERKIKELEKRLEELEKKGGKP